MYSLSVSGSVVQLHFCGNDYKSFSVNATNKEACCCPIKADGGKESNQEIKEKSCCSQKDLSLKIDIDQSNNNGLAQLQILQTPALLVSEIGIIFQAPVSKEFAVLAYPANAPPDGNWQQIPLYKLFGSLVYYG